MRNLQSSVFVLLSFRNAAVQVLVHSRAFMEEVVRRVAFQGMPAMLRELTFAEALKFAEVHLLSYAETSRLEQYAAMEGGRLNTGAAAFLALVQKRSSILGAAGSVNDLLTEVSRLTAAKNRFTVTEYADSVHFFSLVLESFDRSFPRRRLEAPSRLKNSLLMMANETPNNSWVRNEVKPIFLSPDRFPRSHANSFRVEIGKIRVFGRQRTYSITIK
jgi:hypothetical protein